MQYLLPTLKKMYFSNVQTSRDFPLLCMIFGNPQFYLNLKQYDIFSGVMLPVTSIVNRMKVHGITTHMCSAYRITQRHRYIRRTSFSNLKFLVTKRH